MSIHWSILLIKSIYTDNSMNFWLSIIDPSIAISKWVVYIPLPIGQASSSYKLPLSHLSAPHSFYLFWWLNEC